MEQPFVVTVSGPGLAFEQRVSAEQAAAVVSMILHRRGVRPGAGAGEATAPGSGEVEPAEQSAGEYLSEAGATTNAERMAAFAAYLRDVKGAADFARDEVRGCFVSAGEPEPRNFARDFNTALAKHWLSEMGNKPGRFYITNSGLRAVLSGFGRKPAHGEERTS